MCEVFYLDGAKDGCGRFWCLFRYVEGVRPRIFEVVRFALAYTSMVALAVSIQSKSRARARPATRRFARQLSSVAMHVSADCICFASRGVRTPQAPPMVS